MAVADPPEEHRDRETAARWRIIAVGVASAAFLIMLAMLGQARLGAVAIAAVATLAVALALSWPRRSISVSGGGNVLAAPANQPEQEPPFAIMFEHLADPILLIAGGRSDDRGDRRFLFANAAARELFRLQRQEGPLTTAIRAPEVLNAVEDALFGDAPAQADYQSRGVQERFWRVHVSPLDAPGVDRGQGLGRLVLLRMRDETDARRGERTRADFLANASHELRTPLASLAGFIETLRGHARDDSDAREKFLAIMHLQAERMRRLIDDLMSLSRIELGEHIQPSGRVDIALTVIEVLDALGPLAAEGCVVFQQTLPPPGRAVAIGDRDQIAQVIQNLVENAVKYTSRDAVVTVEVLSDVEAVTAAQPTSAASAHLSLLTPDHNANQRYIALRVRDRGAGIERVHLPRLTERFYRVEGQKSRERAGTGLGLAIVKHIINRHRGGLAVESAEGVGSVFTAYIPMADETAGADSVSGTGAW